MELSFGEQIKILLKRKGLTIKELADMYEAQTGRPMSRQNLTQRLKRDNFPEQDMHIIAALLGYQVSVQLTPVSVPMPEFMRAEVPVMPAASVQEASMQAASMQTASAQANSAQRASFPAYPQNLSAPSLQPGGAGAETGIIQDEFSQELSGGEPENSGGIRFQIPEAFRKNKPQGDVNPLTGEEYLTNTVRRHPELEEFVQVYDQGTHAWADVREDYFWEFQDKKKQMLGKDYRAPILI